VASGLRPQAKALFWTTEFVFQSPQEFIETAVKQALMILAPVIPGNQPIPWISNKCKLEVCAELIREGLTVEYGRGVFVLYVPLIGLRLEGFLDAGAAGLINVDEDKFVCVRDH